MSAWPRFMRGVHGRRSTGFSLVESTVVLVVVSLLSWAAFTGYQTSLDDRARAAAEAALKQLQTTVRTFAMHHGRLPCPDTSAQATGYETLTGNDCSGGATVGWLPYISLGLAIPELEQRARYAVFRASSGTPASDADLAVAIERTGDTAGGIGHLDVGDLIVGLNNAAGLALSTSRPYLTGDNGAAGTVNCQSNPVMPAAYWLVVPLQDRSGDGDRLDPPHALNSLCVTAMSAPLRADSNDVVLAESPVQLAGWLRQTLP